jgi:hypothetical protein
MRTLTNPDGGVAFCELCASHKGNRMRRGFWVGVACGACVPTLFFAGLASGAVRPQSAPASIKACVSKTTGIVRIAKSCKSSETRLIWSVTGPQGLRGIPGPKGDPAVTNVVNVTAPPTTVPTYFNTADYPPGTIAPFEMAKASITIPGSEWQAVRFTAFGGAYPVDADPCYPSGQAAGGEGYVFVDGNYQGFTTGAEFTEWLSPGTHSFKIMLGADSCSQPNLGQGALTTPTSIFRIHLEQVTS